MGVARSRACRRESSFVRSVARSLGRTHLHWQVGHGRPFLASVLGPQRRGRSHREHALGRQQHRRGGKQTNSVLHQPSPSFVSSSSSSSSSVAEASPSCRQFVDTAAPFSPLVIARPFLEISIAMAIMWRYRSSEGTGLRASGSRFFKKKCVFTINDLCFKGSRLTSVLSACRSDVAASEWVASTAAAREGVLLLGLRLARALVPTQPVYRGQKLLTLLTGLRPDAPRALADALQQDRKTEREREAEKSQSNVWKGLGCIGERERGREGAVGGG